MAAAAAPTPIRVVIADDHELFAEGLAEILGAYPDVEVVGRAADGVEAIALASALVPDLVLMDVEMPRLDGISATREIAAGESPSKVLMVSAADEGDVVAEARRAGAVGYVFKGCALTDVIAAIRQAASPSGLVAVAAIA